MDSGRCLEALLISAVAAVPGIRAFLTPTGYPRLGAGLPNIVHMLWGGSLMLAALFVSLSFLGARARWVTAIDFSSGSTLSQVGAGLRPVGVAVNAATNRVYVTNSQSNSVSVIDGATNSVVATIPTGGKTWGVEVDSATNRVCVATDPHLVKVFAG